MAKEGIIAIDFCANYTEIPVDKTKRKQLGDVNFIIQPIMKTEEVS